VTVGPGLDSQHNLPIYVVPFIRSSSLFAIYDRTDKQKQYDMSPDRERLQPQTLPPLDRDKQCEEHMQKFSLIVPTLNEADNIGPLLARIDVTLTPSGLEPEILFVDDGSRDGTRQRIETYTGPLTVRLIRRDHEHGLAGAVVTGALAATHDLVAVMDADLSHPPEALSQLLAV